MKVSVNTQFEATQKIVLPSVVAQGDSMSPLEASVQVENISQIKKRMRKRENVKTAKLYPIHTRIKYQFKFLE